MTTADVMSSGTPVPKSGLVDRLAAHKNFEKVPRKELEWLCSNGDLRRYERGDVIVPQGVPVTQMIIILDGQLAHYVERGTGRRKFMEWHSGDATGLLPYSRLNVAPGTSVIEEETQGLVFHKDQFPELIHECPTVTAMLVHAMLDRARQFTSTDWQDEKVMSLGRLAAGLAHELNNPASAVARSATLLTDALAQAEETSHDLGAADLTDDQRERVEALRRNFLLPATTGVFSAIERADHEDELLEWLESHGADTAPAQALADSGVSVATLDELADVLPGEALDLTLRWIAARYTTRSLATDIERAATRIHDLVSAVKRFTYMDRATIAEPTNIAQGLMDTVAVLASKAKAKSVAVTLSIPGDLPFVRVYGGELNQVWANLLENALDAVNPSGRVTMSAAREGDRVVVRFVDDGPGIAPDVRPRIFDPFFTTKPIGEGSGLGLDISRRIVTQHGGQIEVDSQPGRTEFRVILPVARRSSSEHRAVSS
jgi:signal transduction histidine kinase